MLDLSVMGQGRRIRCTDIGNRNLCILFSFPSEAYDNDASRVFTSKFHALKSVPIGYVQLIGRMNERMNERLNK